MYRCLRLVSAVLLLLVAALLSVACGEEDEALSPVVSATVPPVAEAAAPTGAPKATLAPATPTDMPVHATLVAEASTLAAPVPETEARQKQDRDMIVLASRSSSAPSLSVLRGVGRFNSSSLGQSPSSADGLTVSAIGSVTVPPDEAYVMVVPEQRYGPVGPEQMSSEDRRDIKEKLAGLGISDNSVEFVRLRGYGAASVSVELGTAEVVEMGPKVVDAVEEVVRHSESHGVRYTLSEENCDRALSLARRHAIPSAEKAAADLAQAFGVGVGSVTGILEYPLSGVTFNYPVFDADSCGTTRLDSFGNLVHFDSEQEVDVSVGLQVTYSIR